MCPKCSTICAVMQDLAKQSMENGAHRAEGNKNRRGWGGILMAEFPAEETHPTGVLKQV